MLDLVLVGAQEDLVVMNKVLLWTIKEEAKCRRMAVTCADRDECHNTVVVACKAKNKCREMMVTCAVRGECNNTVVACKDKNRCRRMVVTCADKGKCRRMVEARNNKANYLKLFYLNTD